MKMKNDVAVIIILLIICFIVIPFISQFVVKEGFYNMNTIEVNRVLKRAGPKQLNQASLLSTTALKNDVSFNTMRDYMLTIDDKPGQDVSYNFCIGKLTCDDTYSMQKLPFKDNDYTNLYYPYCVSGEQMKDIRCEGGLFSVTREGETFDASGFTPNYSFNRYQTTENPFYFAQYNLNESKTGRVKANTLLECDFNRDSKKKLECASLENDSRSGSEPPPTSNPLESALLAWFTAQTAGGTGSQTSNSTTSNSNSGSSSGSSDAIKCIADFGTEKGEPLCCGQTGVLQSTKYVCPNTLPYCSDFKCGSKFGTCRK